MTRRVPNEPHQARQRAKSLSCSLHRIAIFVVVSLLVALLQPRQLPSSALYISPGLPKREPEPNAPKKRGNRFPSRMLVFHSNPPPCVQSGRNVRGHKKREEPDKKKVGKKERFSSARAHDDVRSQTVRNVVISECRKTTTR